MCYFICFINIYIGTNIHFRKWFFKVTIYNCISLENHILMAGEYLRDQNILIFILKMHIIILIMKHKIAKIENKIVLSYLERVNKKRRAN